MSREWEDLEQELGAAIPDVEPDEDAELEAEREEIRAEARLHLGLGPDADLEVIQAAFGRSLWDFWVFFFEDFRIDRDGNEVPSGDFHEELASDLQELVIDGRPGEELARAYPREHAKSVYASLVTPTWAVASEHRRFGFVFSDTDRQAWEFLDDIRIEVETNERLQAVYPEFCEWERQPRTNRLAFGNGAILMAAGSGKSVRGARKGAQRPDLIILDDIENDEEVENPNRRKKKMRWYNRVVKKLGRVAVLVIVGTILHAESFLAQQVTTDDHVFPAVVEFPEREDLWEQWETIFHDRALADSEEAARQFYEDNRGEMDRGARVLWPDRFSLYELMVERAEDLASFLSERQNQPFDPSASWFPEDRLQFLEPDQLPPETDVVFSVAFWDPSRGTSRSDTSALPRLDCFPDGRRIVTEAICDRIPPEEVMEASIGMHKRRAFDVLGVEKVALSSYDEQLRDLGAEHDLALPIEPVTPEGSKEVRIRSMRPLVVSGQLAFAESLPLEAKRQVKFYPQHPNDDFWDAVQQANKLADQYLRDVDPAGGTREPEPGELDLEPEDAFGRDRFFERERSPGLVGRLAARLGAAWEDRG